MNTGRRAFFLFAILAAVCGTLPVKAASDTIKLFNGKDLSGWKAHSADPNVKMQDVWSVKDGIITCQGKPLGYLYTERTFTNYKLAVEWRWPPGVEPTNSGIFLRINGGTGGIPRTIENQLKSGNAGDLYGFHGFKIDGDPARTKKNTGNQVLGDFIGVSAMAYNEKAPGQWNRCEITVDGPNLKVVVNGKVVNEAHDCEVLAGPVGLQSEGGEVQFRLVELTPLP